MVEFRLAKWYLDCVTESGDVSIFYSGLARWGRALRLNYSSAIETTGAAVTTRRSFRSAPLPDFAHGAARWQSAALHIDGEWRAESDPVRATIFSSSDGSIEWECLMPRARVSIGGRQGFGYVERLTMTIAPWKLPLRTLRWGRFVSASDWVVWIQWYGDSCRTLVYRNGVASAVPVLDDSRIEFTDGARLALDRSLEIRNGRLGSTAFSRMPALRHTVPGCLLQVQECKWRSRARLEDAGGNGNEGWAIHEIVRWPQ